MTQEHAVTDTDSSRGALRDRHELFDRGRAQRRHPGVKTEAYHRITNAAVGDGRQSLCDRSQIGSRGAPRR